MDLSPIRTIVVVMMENRSFDHLLGYLSLPPFKRPGVAGQIHQYGSGPAVFAAAQPGPLRHAKGL
jgi:phospholipase C